LYVCEFVTDKLGSLAVYPHTIHILYQHDSGTALVRNLFALTVYCTSLTHI